MWNYTLVQLWVLFSSRMRFIHELGLFVLLKKIIGYQSYNIIFFSLDYNLHRKETKIFFQVPTYIHTQYYHEPDHPDYEVTVNLYNQFSIYYIVSLHYKKKNNKYQSTQYKINYLFTQHHQGGTNKLTYIFQQKMENQLMLHCVSWVFAQSSGS